jgi:hypothetical protein
VSPVAGGAVDADALGSRLAERVVDRGQVRRRRLRLALTHEIEMTVAAGAIALTISLSSSTSNSPELGAAS